MDTGLPAAYIALGFLAVILLRFIVKPRLPAVVMPYADLSPSEQALLTQRKYRLRGLALAFFILSAILLFTAMPRLSALIAAIAGFVCQYKVFCLRRKYPVYVQRLISENGQSAAAVNDSKLPAKRG